MGRGMARWASSTCCRCPSGWPVPERIGCVALGLLRSTCYLLYVHHVKTIAAYVAVPVVAVAVFWLLDAVTGSARDAVNLIVVVAVVVVAASALRGRTDAD